MNRAQRRKAEAPRRQMNNALRWRSTIYSEQMYLWRYCENHWWRMSSGWGFRCPVPANLRDEAHNLGIMVPMQWQAISITYLKDNSGKRYRQFGFAKTAQRFKGISEGICPLLNAALQEAEASLNPKHIYGRAMVFAPWTRKHSSLLPVLKLRQKELRLTDADLEELKQAEEEWRNEATANPKAPGQVKQTKLFLPLADIDARIAALL